MAYRSSVEPVLGTCNKINTLFLVSLEALVILSCICWTLSWLWLLRYFYQSHVGYWGPFKNALKHKNFPFSDLHSRLSPSPEHPKQDHKHTRSCRNQTLTNGQIFRSNGPHARYVLISRNVLPSKSYLFMNTYRELISLSYLRDYSTGKYLITFLI